MSEILGDTVKSTLKQVALWGGVAYRWPGGFWCGEPRKHGTRLPDWSTTPHLRSRDLQEAANAKLLDAVAEDGLVVQFRLPLRSGQTLELLIEDYSAAINSTKFDVQTCARLSDAVDAEAYRIGYPNHARLSNLHAAFRQRRELQQSGEQV